MALDALVALTVAGLAVAAPTLLAVAFLRLATRGPGAPMKEARFEAGNPPRGPGRFPALYQYLGYVLMFIALDPVFMLLFVLPSGTGRWMEALLLSLASVAVLLPPLAYALRYARRPEYWRLQSPGGEEHH
ncbi:MAG: hypothetical protein GXO15_05850 [Crenarchaeota archaeon]|nr:hypothetical protein [Thermoproteota archaeon]